MLISSCFVGILHSGERYSGIETCVVCHRLAFHTHRPACTMKYCAALEVQACEVLMQHRKIVPAMQVTPRGVQLVLGTEQEPAMVDTVVMAIMGYFQLKARPGAFALQLAQGRSKTLYVVDNSTAGVAPQARFSIAYVRDSSHFCSLL